MSWKEKIGGFLGVETPEQRSQRQAREASELEAYAEELTRQNIQDAAIRYEEARLEMALHGDEVKARIIRRGSRSADRTIGFIDRAGARMSESLGESIGRIFLDRIDEPVKKEELRRLSLQSAEGYWVDLLSQPPVSTVAARVGNQRLREIRALLNPPTGPNRNP